MNEATYTFERDYGEPRADGTGYQLLWRAGEQVTWLTAVELGLVTGDPPATPKPRRTSKNDADNG